MSARAAFPEGSHEVLAALRREVKTKAEFQRVQAVWLRVTVGLSDEQIAQAVGLSANTVRCLSSRFRCQGASALTGTGRGGRRHENLTVAQEQALLQPFLDLAGQGHLLQINPIKTAYEQVVGHPVPGQRSIVCSAATAGASWPRDHVTRRRLAHDSRRLKKLPELVQDAVRNPARQGRPVRLMFQDEARFGRISDPRRCWAPPGVRPVVSAQVVRQYTYAFAAVSPHDGTLDSLILPQANGQMMSLFLQEVARRHPEEFVLIVLDGAGWHRATHLVVPPQLHLIYLPPYSPELNPAEHLWDEIREKWFPNLLFHDLSAVEDVLEDALRTLEKDPVRVSGLAGFEWVINIPLNAI